MREQVPFYCISLGLDWLRVEILTFEHESVNFLQSAYSHLYKYFWRLKSQVQTLIINSTRIAESIIKIWVQDNEYFFGAQTRISDILLTKSNFSIRPHQSDYNEV